jgi:hypothetical protein
MRLLREQGRIKRCKRPVIFSVEQDAPCPAHKRSVTSSQSPVVRSQCALRPCVVVVSPTPWLRHQTH